MNLTIGCLVLLIAIPCVQCTNDIHKKNHVQALCYRCTCYNVNPFSVDCQNMRFKEVPEIRKDLKLSWRLQLQGNSLTSLPVFPHLENLTALSLGYNQIEEILDGSFANLTNLHTLDLTKNNLRTDSFSPNTFKGLDVPFSSPIQVLNLSHNSLNELPKSVFRYLTNLTCLDLSHNFFRDLLPNSAKSIQELSNLRTLNLSYTGLDILPQQFFANFRYLEELDLSGNNFFVLLSEIKSAHSLRTLYLNNNPFTVIATDSFSGSLKKLRTLHLTGCRMLLRIEDGAFGDLVSLDVLWMNNNPHLTDIHPFAFTNQDKRTVILKELHLENNGLQRLSNVTLDWEKIRLFNLQGNPWVCDCDLKWLRLIINIVRMTKNADLTTDISCAEPPQLKGKKIGDIPEIEFEMACALRELDAKHLGLPYGIVASIVVAILLVTGAIILSCFLYRRSQRAQDWVGNMVKYRKTGSEDEEMITSNIP